MKQLSVTVISDPHYYSKKNWIDADPFCFPPERDQQYRRGSEEILKYVFDEICKPGEPEIVLINGDLTNNGERTSHEEMRELLRSLKKRGKRVFVTTATHDYGLENSGYSYGFDKNNNHVEVPAFKRDELFDYYYEFGMNEAVSVHKESMSYAVELNDSFMLLALNDDHGKVHAGYTDDCLEWIKEQIERAKKENRFVIAMTHHPMLSPSALYKLIAPTNVIEDGEKTASLFADMGVPCIITGHSHIHNISSIKSENGNVFYDISTSSIIGYPPYYRHITFDTEKREIDVSSTLLGDIPNLDTDGKPFSEYIKDLFIGSIGDIFQSAEKDYDKFAELAVGFSMEKEKSYRMKPIIRPVGWYFNHLTFGRIRRFSLLSSEVGSKEIKTVKSEKVMPFVVDMIANLYKGDANMRDGSEKDRIKYNTAVGFFKHLDKLSKPFSKKLKAHGIESIYSVIKPLLMNDGICDSDAVLKY